jgi:LacI family transcriptional regulator
MTMRPTISDIARRAGVSKTTVSRVINNKPDVDKETREKINAIIKEFHYKPSQMAINLSTGKRNLIGLLVPSMTHSFSLEIVKGVAQGIEDSQFEMVLFTTGLSGNNNLLYSRAISSDLVDGLIVVLPRNENELFLRAHHNIPMIAVDYRGIESQIPGITVTNKEGAYELTRYLIGLGHKKIGFITGLLDLGCSRERLEGFRAAMDEAGLPIDETWIANGDFTRVSGKLIGMKWLQEKDFPTAIFASNDDMALGVMDSAKKLGVQIPEHFSLVGFDDEIDAKYCHPPLTTVRQPLFVMGLEAVKALIMLLDGHPISSIELKTELIIRDSCRSPKS